MKILHIATLHRRSGWLARALASDRATEVVLEEAVGVTAGLSRLRDALFDGVLVTHEPGVLDGLELVEGLRAGGAEETIVILGRQPEQEMTPLCYEVGADGYCSIDASTTRTLLWTLARGLERHQLIRENRRLVQAERQRLRHEHREAERLLSQQRSMIADLEMLCTHQAGPVSAEASGPLPIGSIGAESSGEGLAAPPLPERLICHYRDLLRTYVIMGTGNLGQEMAALADLLVVAGVTARQTMQLHVHVLEALVRGLGTRSARHVMNRADLLILEVMVHLAEGYRQRLSQHLHPPRQAMLPGFDGPPLKLSDR